MVIIIFGRRIITSFFVLLLIAIQLSAQEKTSSDYLQGRADGERDAKGNPLWIAAGCLPPYGNLAAYLIKPNPPAHALLGKSASYIQGYTEGYKSKSARKNVMYSCLGTGCTMVVATVAIIQASKESKESCDSCNETWDECWSDVETCTSCLESGNSADCISSILLSLKSIF